MPTPFYHIQLGEDILAQPGFDPDLRASLEDQRGAFLLGNTSPDVQAVSRQDREATHFFRVPPREETSLPWVRLLETEPKLALPARLPADQAAFIAGYLCHLLADWLWIQEVYLPIFGPHQPWATFRHRLYLHNVLRTYLDLKMLASLPDRSGACLEAVQPRGWLPFIQDHHLEEWRNFITSQLKPGALPRTVEVFSQRQGIPRQDFEDLLASEERMDVEVFDHLPRQKLDCLRSKVVAGSINLIRNYYS